MHAHTHAYIHTYINIYTDTNIFTNMWIGYEAIYYVYTPYRQLIISLLTCKDVAIDMDTLISSLFHLVQVGSLYY